MKKIEEMNMTEQYEIAYLFEAWLSYYTDEVIDKVMQRKDEIINDEFTMHLLTELKQREDQEKQQRRDVFWGVLNGMYNAEGVHNHPLIHAKSYRDVLYDMYIRDI